MVGRTGGQMNGQVDRQVDRHGSANGQTDEQSVYTSVTCFWAGAVTLLMPPAPKRPFRTDFVRSDCPTDRRIDRQTNRVHTTKNSLVNVRSCILWPKAFSSTDRGAQ